MKTVYKFIEQIKKNYFRVSEQEQNFILYALVKGFKDHNIRYVCLVDHKDIFHFLDIEKENIEALKDKIKGIIQKFSVKIEDKKSIVSFNLIERCLSDNKGIVITFNLENIDKWLKNVFEEEKLER